jgi:serine protease Do
VLVTEVYKGDPADKAGIQIKDVIVAVDGKPVSTARDLSRLIAGTAVGKITQITVLRNGEEKTLSVKLAKRDDASLQARQEQPADDNLGLSLVEMSPESARRFGYEESEKGLLVADVVNGSPADASGIQQGDLIKEVDRHAVETVKAFQDQIAKVKKGDTLQLLIRRGRVGFLVIKITR